MRPRFLLVMGEVAARSVLNTRQGLKSLRGKWQTVSQPWADVQVMPTFHPGYLLGAPQDKRVVFQDLMALQEAMYETLELQGR